MRSRRSGQTCLELLVVLAVLGGIVVGVVVGWKRGIGWGVLAGVAVFLVVPFSGDRLVTWLEDRALARRKARGERTPGPDDEP